MAEYIEREAAVKELDRKYGLLSGYHPQFYTGYQFAKKMMEQEPAADVAPVAHGRWVIVDDGVMIGDGKHMECSVCHTWKKDRIKTDYCPNCGARMDLEV